MPYVNVLGLDFYYEDDNFTDPWTEPEVLWIQHGFGRSSQFFYHWVPRLARRYRVLRRDLRGHGQSSDPSPARPWTVDDMLEDMIGFMDALGLKTVHYVGDSAGGVLGAAFAARWPERVKSLTMMSSPIADPSRDSEKRYGFSKMADMFDQWPIEKYVRNVIELRGLSILGPEHEAWVLKEWSKNRPASLKGLAGLFPSVDISTILPQIRVPTLFLSPANSSTAPLDEQKRMAALVPGARMAVIDGIGHEIYVDQAEACLDALQAFLVSLQGPADPLETSAL